MNLLTHTENNSAAQSGMIYILVLFLMMIVCASSLAFLSRVSADRRTTQNRLPGIRAGYLAESAANHAMWRLLNEPAFPADSTVYYMHSFAGGRYGYKVRRHSDTTFATIAVVGAVGENTVHQSYVLYVVPEDISYDCPNLVGYWQMDASMGGYASDTSGNDNDGSLTNMDPLTDWISGKIYNALDFDGINDHVLVPHDEALSLNSELTLAAWVFNSSLSGRETVVSKGYTTTYNYWMGTSGNELEFTFLSSWGSLKTAATTGLGLLPNQWHHVAAVYDPADGNRVMLYHNGEPVFKGSVTLSPGETISTDNGPLYIGNSPFSEYWQGPIDEVRIYNTALSTAEIKALYLMTEPGCNTCNPDYSPAKKISEFSTAAMGAGNIQGVGYLYEGTIINGVPAPAGGAYLCIDETDDLFYMVTTDGTLLTTGGASSGSIKSVSLVTSGTWTGFLVVADSALAAVNYVAPDFSITALGFSTSSFGASQPSGAGFIETTTSGTYDSHIAVVDRTTARVYIADQAGVLKTSLDVSHPSQYTQHVAHIPVSDKLMVAYDREVRIYDFSGSQIRQYDTTEFNGTSVEAVIINPLTCEHILSDKLTDTIMTLALDPGNSPPVVSAGPDLVLVYPSLSTTLEGTVTDDGNPSPPGAVTITWSQVSGPEGVMFDTPGNPLTTVTFPEEGEYVLRLSANDGDQNSSDDISVTIAPAGSCYGNYKDSFSSPVFNGSAGTFDWSGNPWGEVGESDGPGSGDVQITDNLGDSRLQLRDNDNGGEGVEREMDLSGAGSATLNFRYRRQGLDTSSDYVKVEISTNDATNPWAELMRIEGPVDDDDYMDATIDITDYAAPNTRIRFVTSPSMGNVDYVWIDDVEITCSP